MMTLTDIAEKNWAVMVEDAPRVSLKLMDAGAMEHTLQSFLQRAFGLYEEDEGEEEDCAEGYLCWTCGASYETGRAREFLWHIRECCKNRSSSKK